VTYFLAYPGMRRVVARHSVRGLYPWARLVRARAIQRAPVRTGRLRSRIRIVPTTDSLRIVTDATNGRFVYAAAQERRRPYLRPAIR
jgi:hypothetical protein